jgi:hypothetical protein
MELSTGSALNCLTCPSTLEQGSRDIAQFGLVAVPHALCLLTMLRLDVIHGTLQYLLQHKEGCP